MIRFIALTMMRLIHRKTKQVLGPESGKDLNWTCGLSGARLSKAFANWQADELPGEYYRIQNATGEDIRLLFRAFGIEVPAKIYTKGDICELKPMIGPFCPCHHIIMATNTVKRPSSLAEKVFSENPSGKHG